MQDTRKQEYFKLLLDFDVKAPLVIVPSDSKSSDMLIADLGHLKARNFFSAKRNSESEESILHDNIDVLLSSVKVCR